MLHHQRVQGLLISYAYLQDSNDHNPMLRALAIRTMGCIRVDRIIEYLCDPLERALKVWIIQRSVCDMILLPVNCSCDTSQSGCICLGCSAQCVQGQVL
jgi:hypothetical protein